MNLCDPVKNTEKMQEDKFVTKENTTEIGKGMKKNSKSKIPVPVTKQRSNLYNQRSSQAGCYLQNKKNSVGIKTTKVHTQEQSSLKTNLKCASISTNNKTLKNNIKSKNKVISETVIMKSNVVNKGIVKTCNINLNAKSRRTSSYKSKIKSCTDKNLMEDKKENFFSPKCNFKVETCSSEENQVASKEDSFSTDKNVEFEANELYRKMILCNVGLSPCNRNLTISPRLSSLQCQRPSVYQKLEIPNDPMKVALKALENTCLSVKRIKKEVKLTQSPYRDGFRDSIYTPRGDPNEAFAKRLEDFKLKQMQKTLPRSNKKVTFNLNVQECTPKDTCDIQNNLPLNSRHRLLQINEKSEENTPNSPHTEKNSEITENSSKIEHSVISDRITQTDDKISNIKIDNIDIEYKKIKATDECDTTVKSCQRTTEPIICDKSFDEKRTISLRILEEISCQNSLDFIHDSKTIERQTNYLETNNIQPVEEIKMKQNFKIYTPKPISLFSKTNESYSPEFLVDGKSASITNLAPICTPLVLKSQARNMLNVEADEGPIPLKLDFTEEETETPKKKASKNFTVLALDKIVTIQKKLDYLADQECYHSLVNENFPVICGRYLTNPLATILNDGDDMHFIPI